MTLTQPPLLTSCRTMWLVTGVFSREAVGQATTVIQSYTGPAGGAVLVSGCHSSCYKSINHKNDIETIILKKKNFMLLLWYVRTGWLQVTSDSCNTAKRPSGGASAPRISHDASNESGTDLFLPFKLNNYHKWVPIKFKQKKKIKIPELF